MGQYYDWINLDKKEYICPSDFSYGNKLYESSWSWNPVLTALYELLDSDWKGDDIIFLGDYAEVEDIDNPALNKLFDQFCEHKGEGLVEIYDYELEYYKCISGLFKAAEDEVRYEIEWMVENDDFEFNQYRVDKRDPYKGLFERDGKQFRYTINDTKKEFFNIEETQSYERDGIVFHYNPLHILLCYARYVEPGAWLGDNIRVSNDRPDGDYTDISKDIVI